MKTGTLMLLLVVASTHAHAVQLCRGAKGVVALRDVCRTKERTLTAADLGVAGAPGPAGEQGPALRRGPVLVDASGADVGPVVELSATGSSNQVCFDAVFSHPSLPGPVLLAVTGDGQLGGVITYASADCTGTPYIDLPPLLLPVAVGINEAVYVADLNALGTVSPQSHEYTNRPIYTCTRITERGGCCAAAAISRPTSAYAVISTTRTALGLHTPFGLTTR